MASRVIPVETFDLVIFGGTGDLARRKILPGLYRRFIAGQMNEQSRIIGAARADMTDDDFRTLVRDALVEFVSPKEQDTTKIAALLERVHYVSIDAKGTKGWEDLKKLLDPKVVQAFYFSVAPGLFGDIALRLKSYKVANENARVVVEKPFGHDLASARALNMTLAQHFDESQIYRIDHYLGKETVQNLMATRFANILFEPIWNSQYIDHVQITVSETVGVEGRGAYYDTSGAMRDMVQNHMMQLLCLIAMEPPYTFAPDAVRDEKLKVIHALDRVSANDVVRGQYLAGNGQAGYLEHCENPNSRTESFAALKIGISNWRWKGTPFYLRTGKRLRARGSEIAIVFKHPPHSIFTPVGSAETVLPGNVMVIRLQPDEGINLYVTIKEPGPGGMRLMQVPLDMSFAKALGEINHDIPDAYERLIMDVIRGNQTLFMRGDEVEAAWAWSDPIIHSWEQASEKPKSYEPGSSGPEEALMLLHKDGRRWRDIR